MSYVLTTVYSESNGNGAMRYAAELAVALKLPLRLVLPYIVPVTMGEMPMPLLPVDEVRNAASGHLNQSIEEIKGRFPLLSMTGDVAYGGLADVLADEADAAAPVLTVIGRADEEQEWLGDDSNSILRDGRGLVLNVPSNTTSPGLPQQIFFACDAKSISEGLETSGLLTLQATLGFRITVFHVVDNEAVSYSGSKLEQQLAAASPEYVELRAGGDLDKAIASFGERSTTGWLALAPHHYGFWTGLFHKSHTNRVLQLADMPVLALHETNSVR